MGRSIRFAFGASGDREAINDETQSSGIISYQQGYPPLYEADPETDPNAIRLSRSRFNQLMHDVTDNIRDWQRGLFPDYITPAENGGAPVSYPLGMVVNFNGVYRESTSANNTAAPSDNANWSDYVNNESIRDLTTYTDINQWIASDDSALYVSTNYSLPGNITIPAGKKVIFVDDGAFTMTNTSIVWNGEIEAPRRHIFQYNGALNNARVTGNPQTEEWLSDWFGVIPDGTTDYVTTGRMFALPTFSAATRCTVVFTNGLYNCGIDNTLSNTTFRCEPNAVFAGVVHAAINNDSVARPDLNPKNVKWIGKVITLTRFGTFHCDGVDVEEVIVRDDASNAEFGYAGGVHLLTGTKNFSCRKMTIEASIRNFGLGVDADDSNLPEGINIGHVEVITSDVLGVYLRMQKSNIDSINIRNWGQGNSGDTDLSLGLPGETDSGIVDNVYGLYALDCSGVTVGQLSINGSGYGNLAEHALLLKNGGITITDTNVRGAPANGMRVLSGDHQLTKADIRTSVSDGISHIGGTISGTSLVSSFNTGKAYDGTRGSIDIGVNYQSIKTNNNTGVGATASAVRFCVDEWESRANGATDYNLTLTSPAGRIGNIISEAATVNTAGGVLINTGTSRFTYGIESNNDGSATQQAVFVNGGANRICTHAAITNSNGQALRLVSASDCSFSHVSIPNGSGDGVVGSGLTRVSFSNSNNALSTNLVAGNVAEFNNNGIT